MSRIYEDLEESFLREFNSSTKESLEDVALDQEEKNKIIYKISGSLAKLPELRADYSDFANHVFFGSAYNAVNYALKRIFDYPLDGELREINEWKNLNSGYENWFFDNFPKDTGHIFLTSGSNGPSIFAKDYQEKIDFSTGSLTLEALVKFHEDIPANYLWPLITVESDYAQIEHSVGLFLTKSAAGVKNLTYRMMSGSNIQTASLAYDSYISSSHFVSVVYNRPEVRFFVDGNLISSASLSGPATGSYNMGVKNIHIGYMRTGSVLAYASASLDEVRIWGDSRKDELIKRNFKRTIYANKSGSLGLYYKFNEPWLTSSNKIVDYSGNELEGSFSGSYTISTNFVSGVLGNSFNDSGDLILDFTNDRVYSFIDEQRTSGTLHDKNNSNYIFELVPAFMTDDEGTEEIRKFLLLIARHWDRLKLYIQHLSNLYNSTQDSFEDTPDDFLNFVAQHYGIDLGGVYEAADPLQYFYGEEVLSSGSLDSSIRAIKGQTKRNLLNNLIYFYKTKSTKEAIKAAVRALGIDSETLNINQYSIFSGGLETTRELKNVERRTLRFDGTLGQEITLHSSSYNNLEPRTFEFRFQLLSSSYTGSSAPLTSSIFRLETSNSASNVMEVEFWRENLTSSRGYLAVYHSSSTDSPITSSLFEALNNNWINTTIYRDIVADSNLFGFNVLSLNRDSLDFHFSGSGTVSASFNTGSASPKFGSTVGKPLYANLHEVRVWNKILTSSTLIENHTKDFESVELENFFEEIDGSTLLTYLKLNDKTGSVTTGGPLHDYLDAKSGSSYYGFSSSGEYNFPGSYMDKLEPSLTYDLNADNSKIRIKDRNNFERGDVTEDISFLSVDFSPVSTLNKEIIKWFGGIEKFSNIIGYPYLKYRDEVTELNAYRNKFFSSKVEGRGIDFSKYLDIIKWFDSNFSYFLSQLIPLDIKPSLSTFVVEPHILEHNKVKSIFPYADNSESRMLESTINVIQQFTATTPTSIGVADPGRYGAAASASAFAGRDMEIDYSSSFTASALAVNYRNVKGRNFIRNYLSGNVAGLAIDGQGNGYYTTPISCSNYEYRVLNAIMDFVPGDIHYVGDASPSNTGYLTSSQGEPLNTAYSKSINTVLDSRWLYWDEGSSTIIGPSYDHGLGYGGAIGQLWGQSNKAKFGVQGIYQGNNVIQVGKNSIWNQSEPDSWIKRRSNVETRSTVILWPTKDSYNGVEIQVPSGSAATTGSFLNGKTAATFGDPINIENYTNLHLNIVGRSAFMAFRFLRFLVQFQFFNEETTESGFESVFSSSFETTTYKSISVPHFYDIPIYFKPNGNNTAANESFSAYLEREIPRAKYMRVHVTVVTNGSLATPTEPGGRYNILIKGTLSNQEKAKDFLSFRSQ